MNAQIFWVAFLCRALNALAIPDGFSPNPKTPDKFYKSVNEKLSIWDAKKECNQYGAELPRFEDEQEYLAVMSIVGTQAL